jgi:hypothetical protein
MAVFVELKLQLAAPNTVLVNLEQIISVSEYSEEITHVKLTDGASLNVSASYREVSRMIRNASKRRLDKAPA